MSKLRKKTTKKLNIVLLIVVTLLVLYFSLKDNFNEIINQIVNMNKWYLFIAFVLLFVFYIFKSLSMYSFCKKINKDFKFRESIQLILRTQFFNAVTPFATGGQPYQIYYLKKCNIDYASSTGIVLQNFIVYQIALVLLGLIALFVNQAFNLFGGSKMLARLIALGFITNTVVIVIMFMVAFSKKMNKRIIGLGIKILTKLKIVKNKEEKLKEWDTNINNFYASAKKLLDDKKIFIGNIIFNFFALSTHYMIPLFILYAMGEFNVINAGISIVACAYVMIIGSFVPIPGGTGGLEYGFVTFFGNFIKGSKLSALMLVWRFITYYFSMILGAIALNIKKVRK